MQAEALAAVRGIARGIALALAGLACMPCVAQNTRWREPTPMQEADTPLPTALRTEGLIDIQHYGSTLRFGVDPQSIQVGADGITRYVVVATGEGGTLNAMQEGIRCDTLEAKTYARHAAGSGWAPVRGATWQAMRNNSAYRHSLLIARGGLCPPPGSPARNASQIAQELRWSAR